jgi:hypothetical protein
MLGSVPPRVLERSLAAWWGFAEGDQMILGLVVSVLGALALTYVLVRVSRGRTARRAGARGRAARRA